MPGRRRNQEPERDSGYSLVELLVAMGVASVLLVAIGVVFMAVTKGVRTIDTQISTAGDGRIAMEAMTRTLRVAAIPPILPTGATKSAVVTATAASVSFYALLNRTGSPATSTPNPTLVAYSYDGACINQSLTPQRTAADGSVSWDQNTSTTCLARTTVAPAFSYFVNGLADTSAISPVPAGGLSAATLPTVRSVQVSIGVRDAKNPTVKAVSLTDRVTLTNVPSAG
jgi:prepilin-type N-terminal cleavage/methylation domain-containing protein